MEQEITLKRTALYVSGSSPVNMIEAIFYNEDCIVYDLEDSVPAAEKGRCSVLGVQRSAQHRPVDKYTIIRVNMASTRNTLTMTLKLRCVRILMQYVFQRLESAKEVRMISERIAEIEHKAGIEVGSIELWCNIEIISQGYQCYKSYRSPCCRIGTRGRGFYRQYESTAYKTGAGTVLCT